MVKACLSPSDFSIRRLSARFLSPEGLPIDREIEIRTHPVTGRQCRITLSRAEETEPGTNRLPPPPPAAGGNDDCPFCPSRIEAMTPQLPPAIAPEGRLRQGRSVLFPNLFPYGSFSAVSLFGPDHFVEIGMADAGDYRDSFINCAHYVSRVLSVNPKAVFTAITQNHLPSAGGSLVHPHLQVHLDREPSNHHRSLMETAAGYREATGRGLFTDYLAIERQMGVRTIGASGDWQWLSAFAPEGFYEIWGILPEVFSLQSVSADSWEALAVGVVRIQKLYRHLCRNGYNLGLLTVENGSEHLELRVVMTVRSNYDAWVRNDHTGFELMLGDMATFTPPEDTAEMARVFWPGSTGTTIEPSDRSAGPFPPKGRSSSD